MLIFRGCPTLRMVTMNVFIFNGKLELNSNGPKGKIYVNGTFPIFLRSNILNPVISLSMT